MIKWYCLTWLIGFFLGFFFHRVKKSIPAPAVPFPGPDISAQPPNPVPCKTPVETRAKFIADDWNHAAYYDLRREGHC